MGAVSGLQGSCVPLEFLCSSQTRKFDGLPNGKHEDLFNSFGSWRGFHLRKEALFDLTPFDIYKWFELNVLFDDFCAGVLRLSTRKILFRIGSPSIRLISSRKSFCQWHELPNRFFLGDEDVHRFCPIDSEFHFDLPSLKRVQMVL